MKRGMLEVAWEHSERYDQVHPGIQGEASRGIYVLSLWEAFFFPKLQESVIQVGEMSILRRQAVL